ncbi:hypothetical protein BS78_02G069500 [Paspalum vaginatum]|nr:hypothetical protein BS78_02G069500 [Paspalum vaginatum]
MASSKPCAVLQDRRVKPALDASNTGVLPSDALYEILLRLPAKEFCRLRVVCRPWRSLLSDPHLIAAHAARHPLPLIVTGYDDDTSEHHSTGSGNTGIIIDIMDLSGHVVKRVRTKTPETEQVMFIQLGLVCTGRGFGHGASYKLLNLSTGAVCALPEGYAPHEEPIMDYQTFVALGKVESTGEYKVLRVIENSDEHEEPEQLYEVCTLDVDGIGSNTSCWRGNKAPLDQDIVDVGRWKNVVIGGIVYFLSFVPIYISSFDLETEEWRQNLQGPLSDAAMDHDNIDWDEVSIATLATLSGSLVVVHRTNTTLDLWFLMDFERGLWVKQHSIPISIPRDIHHNDVCPLLMLDDGRILLHTIYLEDKGWIRTYNPRTNTFTDIAEMRNDASVGLYTGSLLSLPTVAG